jgi:hypothetical protein
MQQENSTLQDQILQLQQENQSLQAIIGNLQNELNQKN